MKNYINLSYWIDEQTPLYGGRTGFKVHHENSLNLGDTCNTKFIEIKNHCGTHIDFPNHFIQEGKTSDLFSSSDLIYSNPFLYEIPIPQDTIIDLSNLELKVIPLSTDFIIFKTGFGSIRNTELYWRNNPGFSPILATKLRNQLPNIRAIGMDTISLTSYQNRELGRLAHKEFLGGDRPILLIEDMNLNNLYKSPKLVICAPLMISKLDGSPVNIIAEL